MGASQSIESATAEQLARVGPFKLRSSEKLAVDALSEIVTNLLRENNLFNLAKVLNYPEGCKSLFIVVSSTAEKEFQLLKFPEPRSRKSMVTMSFIDKDKYGLPSVESDFSRRKACSEITRFLIRLVTLCAAATASISLNTNLGGAVTNLPFEATGAESSVKKELKNLPDYKFNIGPINPSFVTDLQQTFGFVEIDKSRPYLLYFKENSQFRGQIGGGMYDVAIDVRNSVVYNPTGEKSAVFGIKFEELNDQLAQAFERIKRPSGFTGATVGLPGTSQGRLGQLGLMNIGQTQGPSVPLATGFGPSGAGPAATGFGPSGMPTSVPAATGFPGARPAMPGFVPGSGPATTGFVPGSGPATTGFVPGSGPATLPTGLSTTRPFGPGPMSGYPGTMNTRTNVFSGGAGRTRKSGAARRRTYKRRTVQAGGARTYLRVTIMELSYESISCEKALDCRKIEFALDSQGNTILLSDLENVAKGLVSSASSISFTTRVSEALNSMKDTSKVKLLAPSLESDDDRGKYIKIFEPTPKTYETFQRIVMDMTESPTGTGPAPYRAFLLASELDPSKTKLTTMFCLDKWAGKWLTESLGYSLLQSLYNDGLDGSPTSPAAEELQIHAKNFICDKLATEDTKPGEYAKHLGNLKFYPIPSALKDSYCKRSGTAPPFTNIPADKEILTAAHQQLRKLYDSHIAAVVDIMRNVLTIRRSRTDATDFRFRLNEKYSKDPRGALVVLEEEIQVMRRLIAKHYFDVEKVYRTALEQLSYTRRGFTPDAVVNTLGRANAALEKEGI
jgi:hypothetical protein